jgi:Uncharacterized protein containing double-stranded beta helix domain
MAEKQEIVQPEQLHFKDDGVYPGSVLPVLLYRAAITADAQDRASVFERGFAQNDWRNSWRNGVYSFAHYHSTSHEALGVYNGSARLRLGGEHGQTVEVRSGDVILIPAGVAHHNIGASPDFSVVGAYPTDASGICFAVCLANGQNPIAPSQLCQFPITIRSTALTVHCGRSGKSA